jgi:aspartate 1-decarboxylase
VQRTVLKSKIHRATVTRADLDYEGSCSIGPELLEAAGILPGEQVHVVNVSNGSRAVTYAIEGESGEIGLNGAIAHLGGVGDLVILITYAHLDEAELTTFAPALVHVDAANRIRHAVPAL